MTGVQTCALPILKFDIIKQEEFKQYHQHQLTAASAEQAKDLIVFCHAGTEYFALELKQVTRIEPFNPSDVYQVGNLRFVEHHHQAVPLCSMDEFMPVSTAELSGSQAFAVFPRGLSSKVGILASKIVDTLHTDQVLEKDAACPDAVRGKLFMDRKMVQVLDHETLISLIENTIVSKRSSC